MKNLDQNIWKEIQKSSYMGMDFDLTAFTKIRLAKQRLLVKHFPMLDEGVLSDLVKKYWEINKNPRKTVGANLFILCIVADKISEKALDLLSTLPFTNYGKTFWTGERGYPLVVDIESKRIYGGKGPIIPKPVRMRCQSILELIKGSYHIHEMKRSPGTEAIKKRMKSELKKWGFGLIGFGALHLVLASFLDPVWGAILIVVGICNLFIIHRTLFLVNGLAIITAAVFNSIAIIEAEAGAPCMFVLLQFAWGINEIRKYKLYDQGK